MSRFSGKCDLYDHIFAGSADWADYFRRFEEFKEKTGGKMHQERKVLVTDGNLDDVCAVNPRLSYSNVTVVKTDKKGKTKEVLERHYLYWDKEYDSLKKLNKRGVYIRIDIPFDTILDLIPYYPYIIAADFWSKDRETVILSHQPYPDEEIDDRLESGWFKGMESIDFQFHYKHELQEHYRDVFRELNRDIGDRYVLLSLKGAKLKKDGDWYLLSVEKDVDPNHPVKWFFPSGAKTHWTDPRRVDDHTIAISAQDAETYLKDAMESNGARISYIKRHRS